MTTEELLKECEEIAELMAIENHSEKMETLRGQAYTMAGLIVKLADKVRELEAKPQSETRGYMVKPGTYKEPKVPSQGSSARKLELNK